MEYNSLSSVGIRSLNLKQALCQEASIKAIMKFKILASFAVKTRLKMIKTKKIVHISNKHSIKPIPVLLIQEAS